MKDYRKRKAIRKYYRSLEHEEARRAGMDNIIGDRTRYRDPTEAEALKNLSRESLEKAVLAGQPVYTGPDSIPIVTRVLFPDGTVNDEPIPEEEARVLCVKEEPEEAESEVKP